MIGRWLRRSWGRLPASWRRSSHLGLDRVLRATTPLLMASVWRKGRPAGGSITVAGFFTSSSGLGQGVRLFVEALRIESGSTGVLDITGAFQARQNIVFEAGASPRPGGVLISHFNPPELLRNLPRGYWRALRGRRHIGHWAWELAELPQAWRAAFAYVDEVWCPSRFTADAVRKAAPADLPIHVVPHPMFTTPRPPPDRTRWGWARGDCIVLMAFDLKSTVARKNPQGALAAFQRAVPAPRDGVRLACKVSGADQEPALFAALATQVRDRTDIVLIDDALSPSDMTRLVASADIVLSLHRAEGFGLLAAEGLWLGRCVVATAWSGVMDFLDPDSAILVPWTLTPVEDAQGLYTGGTWAEPDLDAAAAALAHLIDDPAARVDLGRRARAHAEQVFDRGAWLAQVRARLTPPAGPDATGPDTAPISSR